jgi:O-antigen ligase
VLGFVLTPALICFLALRPHLTPGVQRNLGGALLVGGLVATVSRGPWVAAVIAALAFWAAANSSRMRVAVGLAALISVAALFDTQIPILPSLASVDQFTVDYRTELFSKSLEVISEHPWFGSEFFRDRLAAKGMLQGEGIVDVVNTYLGVALASGIVGLGFFVTLLAAVLLGTWNSRRRAPRSGKEQGPAASVKHLSQPLPHARQSLFSPSLAGRTLFAAFVGMVVCLASASSISVIPWLFWAWMGTAVAYMRIVRTETTHALRSATAAIPEFAKDSASRPRPG